MIDMTDNVIPINNDLVELGDLAVKSQTEGEAPPLPDHPSQLTEMPHGLRLIQTYIYNQMSYPIPELAGFMSLAVLSAFLQQKVTIKSRQGLGFQNWWLGLLGTGFGKDALRDPFFSLPKQAVHGGIGTQVHSSQAGSKQGLHRLLEENNSIFLMADEFANWVAKAEVGGHITDTLFYAMECYGRTFGTVNPGRVQHTVYADVECPRLSILATSTPDLMFSKMNKEKAEAGAWNRWMMFVGDDTLPPIRYEGLEWEPSDELLDFLSWAHDLQDPAARQSLIKFSPDGWDRFKELNSELCEPIKKSDGLLGGRLAEQAIKCMGLWAVADKRTVIKPADVEAGFALRIGIYERTRAAVEASGALDEGSDANQVFESIRKYVAKKGSLLESQIKNATRRWDGLSLRDRLQVQQALNQVGIRTERTPSNKLKFVQAEEFDYR